MKRKLKIGELQSTQDINQKFSIGILNGNEVWALEEIDSPKTKETKGGNKTD